MGEQSQFLLAHKPRRFSQNRRPVLSLCIQSPTETLRGIVLACAEGTQWYEQVFHCTHLSAQVTSAEAGLGAVSTLLNQRREGRSHWDVKRNSSGFGSK